MSLQNVLSLEQESQSKGSQIEHALIWTGLQERHFLSPRLCNCGHIYSRGLRDRRPEVFRVGVVVGMLFEVLTDTLQESVPPNLNANV